MGNSYKLHGITELSLKKTIQYTGEFKHRLIMEMLDQKLSLHQMSVKYMITHSVIAKWRRDYEIYGTDALFKEKTRGRPAKMIDKAFNKIPDITNITIHSDQGWHYQHKTYRYMLKKKGIIQSMSRKGNCLDNAAIENFFGLLKSELLYLQKFKSMKHFQKELNDYIYYYNNKRIKTDLNEKSPVGYRTFSQ